MNSFPEEVNLTQEEEMNNARKELKYMKDDFNHKRNELKKSKNKSLFLSNRLEEEFNKKCNLLLEKIDKI